MATRELHPLRLPEGFERIPQVAKIGLGDSPKLSRVTEEDLRDVAPSDERLGSGKP